MKCFLFARALGIRSDFVSRVHLSAETELDYDGSSLFINATIALFNLRHNTLTGNLKLHSNISHAKATLAHWNYLIKTDLQNQSVHPSIRPSVHPSVCPSVRFKTEFLTVWSAYDNL